MTFDAVTVNILPLLNASIVYPFPSIVNDLKIVIPFLLKLSVFL